MRTTVIWCAAAILLAGCGDRLWFDPHPADLVYQMSQKTHGIRLEDPDPRIFSVPGGGGAWSPDGSRIAFYWEMTDGLRRFVATGIRVIRADGTGQDQWTEIGGSPSWSPDGKRLAFVHWDILRAAGSGDPDAYAKVSLHVMDADGTGVRKLLDLDDDGYRKSRPSWSPDGRRLVLGASYKMNVIEIDGSGRLVISSGWDPAWAPDAALILAVTSLGEGWSHRQEVFTIRPDGTERTVLTDRGASFVTSPAWSPDGSRIAFLGDGELVVMERDGTGQAVLATDVQSFNWGPAGERLVYSSNRNLTVVGVDGTASRAIGSGRNPAWSPRLP